MKYIRQAVRQDRECITALRIREFQRSAQFALIKPDKLKWNRCDDTSTVLAVWDGPRVVATMRAVCIIDRLQAESCVQCSVPAQTHYPAFVFNSAATHSDYRRLGLNQLLRYHFLKIAMDNGIQSLMSPMYAGAPRIGFMQSLGYAFTTPALSWQNKLRPKATRILGVLKRKKMSGAINLIKARHNAIIITYPLKGKLIRLHGPDVSNPARHSNRARR